MDGPGMLTLGCAVHRTGWVNVMGNSEGWMINVAFGGGIQTWTGGLPLSPHSRHYRIAFLPVAY